MPETPSKFPAIDEKRAYSAIRPSNHISLQQAVTTNTKAAVAVLDFCADHAHPPLTATI